MNGTKKVSKKGLSQLIRNLPAYFVGGLMPFSLLYADEPVHTTENTLIEEVVVFGSSQTLLKTADSASEGLVGYADFSARALSRVGELVEVVPGMVASQHSGEGKANQYFLRGVNLDHGTDFSAYFEGMPINFRSHAHGHGYLDLNFLIPEIVSTVRFQKGPYAADRGDFSTVGTTAFNIYDSVARPFVQVGIGEDGYQRVVSAGSAHLGHGHLLGAMEVTRDDGPWDLPQRLRKNNFLAKYTGHISDVQMRVIASHYDNEWRSTDQVPLRLVDSGAIDRFGFVDPTVGGDTSRSILSVGLENDKARGGVYVSRYELDLYSNFTYQLDNPTESDQIRQVDERIVYGGFANYTFTFNNDVEFILGGDVRVDDIDTLDLENTNQRVFVDSISAHDLIWRSAGLYGTLNVQFTDNFRGSFGLRADYYDYDVNSVAQASGDDHASNVVSSVSLAYALTPELEVYANWGEGYHSNDVRGAFDRIDTETGDLIEAVDVFADQEGGEIGFRYAKNGLQTTLTWFWMRSDSELLFVGDAGNTEPSDGSRRDGVEFAVYWNPLEHWSFDITGAIVDSEFDGVPRGLRDIPNTFGRVFAGGFSYANPNGFKGNMRIRHFGNAPIVEDGSEEQQSSTIVNAGLSYGFGDWEVGVDVLNVFDSEREDIAYFFESQLPGEAAAVEDIHFHPVLPRTFRARIRYDFGARE